jgi:hypothetical protein
MFGTSVIDLHPSGREVGNERRPYTPELSACEPFCGRVPTVPVVAETSLAHAYGALRGQVEIADDFDDLPDDLADAFGTR